MEKRAGGKAPSSSRPAAGHPDIPVTPEEVERLKQTLFELEQANTDLAKRNGKLQEQMKVCASELETARHTLETQMHELAQIREALLRSEKMASIGKLVAGITHEINTPLGVGVTAASFLEASINESIRANPSLSADPVFRKLSAKWADTARIILANLERAGRLVTSFKQVSVDRMADPIRTFCLQTFLEEVLVSLNPMIRRSGSLVENRIPANIRLTTYPGALSQIVINLVTNALQHAFSQDHPGRLTLQAETSEGTVRMMFRDNGVGIPVGDLPRIFEPFFTTSKAAGGSGLGLFIVQNLAVRRLQGTIDCRPVPDGGTEFVLTLPVEIFPQVGE